MTREPWADLVPHHLTPSEQQRADATADADTLVMVSKEVGWPANWIRDVMSHAPEVPAERDARSIFARIYHAQNAARCLPESNQAGTYAFLAVPALRGDDDDTNP